MPAADVAPGTSPCSAAGPAATGSLPWPAACSYCSCPAAARAVYDRSSDHEATWGICARLEGVLPLISAARFGVTAVGSAAAPRGAAAAVAVGLAETEGLAATGMGAVRGRGTYCEAT